MKVRQTQVSDGDLPHASGVVHEARITCTCANIIIADLGLRMTKGSVVYVAEIAARKSKDLMLAARAHGVDVQFVTRAQVVRQPLPVAVGRPKRDLPNLVARLSPIPAPIAAPEPLNVVVPHDVSSLEDILGITDGIFDGPPMPTSTPTSKTRKKKES